MELKPLKFKNTQHFYKSKQWETFRLTIIAERTDPITGYVLCWHCGDPIVKKNDLIIHHKQHLSDSNVNDYSISLNPANCECVHHTCHNAIHERWQYRPRQTIQREVWIVWGSPCSGKTTWVNEHATDNDLIVDLDNLWEAITPTSVPRYTKPSALTPIIYTLQDTLYDTIKHRTGNWNNAYIIATLPRKGDKQRLKQRLNATQEHYCATTLETCLQRLETRDMRPEDREKYKQHITNWHNTHQP